MPMDQTFGEPIPLGDEVSGGHIRDIPIKIDHGASGYDYAPPPQPNPNRVTGSDFDWTCKPRSGF